MLTRLDILRLCHLRMIGYGDNLGTGFPAMVDMWKTAFGVTPKLQERPEYNTVELIFEGLTPQVAPQVVNLLKGIGEDTLSKAEMMEKMHLTDRKSFGRLYLQPALTQGLIEMTIPDKPQSRMQQYRLTKLGIQLLTSL